MSRTVWKFPISDAGIVVELSRGWRVAHVGRDPSSALPTVWVEHDSAAPRTEVVDFRIVGTGWQFGEEVGHHVGTAICGSFVWHVYARAAQQPEPSEPR